MNTTLLPIAILVGCLLLGAAGCKPKTPGLSDIQSTSGDRHIRVLVEGGAWVEARDDGFNVKLAGRELVIGKGRVLIDQQEHAQIPAGAKRFEVISKGGTLVVTSDGAQILKTPLVK